MTEMCEECGKPISRRAKANVWRGEHIVCTGCLNNLKSWELFDQNRIGAIGNSDALWFVDGMEGQGPFRTEVFTEMLRVGTVAWSAKIWREGMREWKSAAILFSNPELSADKQIRLRGFDRPDRPRLV